MKKLIIISVLIVLVSCGGDDSYKNNISLLTEKISKNETIPACWEPIFKPEMENLHPCEFEGMTLNALSSFLMDDFRSECRYFRLSPPKESGEFNTVRLCPEDIISSK